VVRDAVTLSPGDLLRPTELERSSQRLSETGVFRSVDVRPDPAGANPATRDIVVDLAPRDDLSLEYNVRYTTNGSGGVGDAPSSGNANEIQFGAALEASNPFGFAKRTRLYGLVGGERALMGLTFDSATFLGYQWRTQVFLFDDQDRLPDISRLLGRVRGATFQQTVRWGADPANRWRHRVRMLWGYTFKHVRYTDPATLETLSGDRAGLIYSLIGDTRDSVTDPHRGLFWSAGTELALRALGSDVDYLKLFEQIYFYVPLGPRIVWAQGYRLGITPGEDPLLLLEGRFRAGGATSVRGFDENMLGPLTGQNEPLGGQAVAIFNQELRFPIVKRLWGGVFYDAGNAFALVRELRLDALRQSAGAGLRFMFPFGPVRLEHAWVLYPREGEARSRWVFSLGHAF
jgi:outer membrane protein assembly factor BamA